MIVDELYARNHKIEPGMQFDIADRCSQSPGSAGRIRRARFVPDTLQEIMETRDKVSMMFIKRPWKDLKELEGELRKVFVGYHIITANDAAALLEGAKIPMLKEFSFTVVVVSMLISFMVILLAMYTTIFERTREIGILKSLGASKTFVVTMVLRESIVICALGVLLGTFVSQIIRKIINFSFPTLQVEMDLSQIGVACMLGLIAGVLGALYPAYKAAQMDPVKALTYE